MSGHAARTAESRGMFRSLRLYNYRVWASGAIVSNVGTWMQRTAQDWIVLTQLSNHNATAVGIVLACQFAPQLLMLPFTGLAADRFDRRKLIMATQTGMGLLSLALGILTVTGIVTLWQVFIFAFLFGTVAAFDSPARQTFVSDLVSGENLTNAVGLNSTSFNAARMIGPALAGILIAVVGTGWVFIINAATFIAVLCSLLFLRVSELHVSEKRPRMPGDFVDGFRYVWKRPDLKVALLMFFLIGTFGANFPIYLSTMSVTVFHAGASAFGILSSFMAVGSIVGALLAARRDKPRMSLLLTSSALFGVMLAISAVMPTYLLFGLALTVVGVATQTFTTSANSTVQLATDPAMRGRVMAIVMVVAVGGTPIGAPIAGWVADAFGPRWAMGLGAAAGIAAALVGVYYLVRYRELRMHRAGVRIRFSTAPIRVASDSTVPTSSVPLAR